MLIKNMLEDVGDDNLNASNPIPIPNVSHQTRPPQVKTS